jgi:hypothetical protein
MTVSFGRAKLCHLLPRCRPSPWNGEGEGERTPYSITVAVTE